MPDETLLVRREICLKRDYDRRKHAANTFAHVFTSSIKTLTSNIPLLILPSFFELNTRCTQWSGGTLRQTQRVDSSDYLLPRPVFYGSELQRNLGFCFALV